MILRSIIIYQSSIIENVAKRTTNRPQKRLTFIDIIKGNFLNRDEIKIHYKFFLLLFVLMMAMIYSNHLVNKKIKIVNALKEETEEYKSRNAYAQSKLIKVKMESQLGKEVAADSLMTLESHPHKLLIKLDSSDAKTK
ncbi:hypothetical protein SAMN05421800_10183 [Chryseobacterium balustinum]|uniref:S-adenosyl-methyltransferase n=1 Tax=Chryseobacterium balustinum TaxID=246 RepID=A0AAX2IIL7_9FLAO|nr:hypothetical protein SAMN05421800_10183 [Chryseobacterium balustinum]SQA88163.1 Uncharacterised protein [Chryseobacterium balustinum]